MKLNKLFFLIVLITINTNLILTYEITEPTFLLLSPKGFRASIPDQPGIRLFAFNGAINHNILQQQPGDFSNIITIPTNQEWIYENKCIEIRSNDILYYWYHIQINNKTYQLNNGIYPIGKSLRYNDYLYSKSIVTTELPINNNYIIPIPKIERLYPRGFRISIPDENGIKIVAFHGKLNDKIEKFQNGDFNYVISIPINGEWFYENHDINIQSNDILNYWLHVQYGHNIFTYPIHSYQFENDNNDIKSIWFTDTNKTTNNIPIISINNQNYHFIKYNNIINNSINDICEETITLVTNNGNKICKGHLIFEETFDKYDNNKWDEEIKFSGLDGEFVLYDNKKENLYIENGNLIIIPSLSIESDYDTLKKSLDLGNRCTDNIQYCQRNSHIPPILSSKIRTKKSFSFRYGQIDVRAKLPQGDWIFPQINLEPLTQKYGTNYASGQIRIAFIRGNNFLESKEGEQIDGHRLYGGVIIDDNDNLQDIWLKSTEIYPEHFGTEFHNYSLIWTNEYIRMEVDGIPYGIKIRGDFIKSAHGSKLKYTKEWMNGTKLAPFDQDFYISLGVAVGGNVNFPDGTENGPKHNHKPWLNSHPLSELKFWNNREEWKKTWSKNNTKLIVDYIRVYAI